MEKYATFGNVIFYVIKYQHGSHANLSSDGGGGDYDDNEGDDDDKNNSSVEL